MGDEQDKTLTFLDKEPIELAEHGYRLAIGLPMEPFYPPIVRMVMQPESPGLRRATLLGNLMGYLIVHVTMKEVLREFAPEDETEYFSFGLINHKGRVHSSDYWIVNPLGSVDCLDRSASEITYAESDPGQILSVTKFVFDGQRIPENRHLFRITPAPREYFVSEPLAAELQKMHFTNIFVEEVQVR